MYIIVQFQFPKATAYNKTLEGAFKFIYSSNLLFINLL